MADTVTVKSALPQEKDGGFPIAIYDENGAYETDGKAEDSDAHDSALSEGQLFIADDKNHTVPYTAGVAQAINEKRLVVVDNKGNEKDPPPPSAPVVTAPADNAEK